MELKPASDDLTVKFIISGTTSVMHKNLEGSESDRQSRRVWVRWVRQNKDNKASNVHQANKNVQGHDKQNQIKMPAGGKVKPFDVSWYPRACMQGSPKTVKKHNNTTRRQRKDARSDYGQEKYLIQGGAGGLESSG